MSLEEVQKCYSRFDLDGDVDLAVYPHIRAVHIDYSSDSNVEKSFFCDYMGNIICPQQINAMLKKSVPEDKQIFFLNRKVSLIFMKNPLSSLNDQAEEIYINLKGTSHHCIMKILFVSDNFSLGVIEQHPDVQVTECLKLIPQDMENWSTLIIKEKSFRVYSE
jgi:hypothetical protein